jgi:aryl-alcohol dehydrogenase-like predicted oxidoreductase
MNYKQLGRSGLLVTDICLGTMIFGEQSERSTPAGEAVRMIHHYLAAGGNHIDTANVYAGGRSEEIVGRAIRDRRDQVVLATKVRFATGTGRNEEGLSRRHIIAACEASLRRLDTDYIDLYYLHCWDPLTPLDESLRAVEDLVAAGKIRYIGVSNFTAWQMMKALAVSDAHSWSRFVAAQYQYSLVNRDIEYEFSDLCQDQGVGLTPWGPLGGGFLTGKYRRGDRPDSAAAGRIAVMESHTEESWERRNTTRNWDIIDAVGEIAEAREVSYAQVALAWLRVQPAVSSVIIGARTMEQLEDNLGAADLALDETELAALDEASRMPDLYPYRMIANYGLRVADD